MLLTRDSNHDHQLPVLSQSQLADFPFFELILIHEYSSYLRPVRQLY